MRATEAKQFTQAGDATTTGFALYGGRYQVSQKGVSSLQLEELYMDGTTWNTVGAATTADGINDNVDLPPGQYRFVSEGAGTYQIVRVPVAE